ncbi:hypothetical protein INT46_004873 [Mucor plumbeus]|uniref:Transposase Tc1-like domain-containing protein n=1 Tax=Mucor plumbeus TaxID=97098 RepID=A0A8H7QCV5_9FUNG|nr:hypothetical protein INT46_004873 [Mucor plumbeus]
MRQAGVSKSTVYRIKHEIGQTFQRLKPGKPIEDTHKCLNNLGHPIGYEATRKLQHRLGFNCHIKKKQPHLNVDHRKDRLKWAKAHRNWSVTDWKRVIFSDETKINLLESDGIQYTWKEGGQPDQSHNIKETRRHQKSLMVWGCMTSLGSISGNHVKIRLGAYETPAKNVKELWERFDYEWSQFTIKDLEPYYNSMPDSVLACIKNKGGNTGY